MNPVNPNRSEFCLKTGMTGSLVLVFVFVFVADQYSSDATNNGFNER